MKSKSFELLNKHNILRSEFRTFIIDGNWNPSGDVLYYIRKGIKNKLRALEKPTDSDIMTYFQSCVMNSRTRKGIGNIKSDEIDNLIHLYKFLIDNNSGILNLIVNDHDVVVSGAFFLYNKMVCTYFNAGNSEIGLKLGGSYLSIYNGVNYALKHGMYFDIAGSYLKRSETYEKLYEFKKKWGTEVDVSQYIGGSNCMVNKFLKMKRKV